MLIQKRHILTRTTILYIYIYIHIYIYMYICSIIRDKVTYESLYIYIYMYIYIYGEQDIVLVLVPHVYSDK